MFYPAENRIHASITVRLGRMLPRPGEVLVRPGTTVEPADLIGRSAARPRWHYVHLLKTLKIAPEELDALLVKRPPDNVEQGEIIASTKGAMGLYRRVCKAPVTGRLALIQDGHMLIEERGETIELQALVDGRVIEVVPDWGAVIETTGAYIKSAWGTGKSTRGALRMLSSSPDEDLQPEQIDVNCHGAILVAGKCPTGDLFRQAEQMQVRGLVLGSMDVKARQAAIDASIPIVVTEGFGDLPMNAAAFDLFQSHDRNEAVIIGTEETQEGCPPEIVIPVVTATGAPLLLPPSNLEVGQSVRITGYPQLGATGHIVAIPDHSCAVESGARYKGVEVEIEGGETLFTPWTNVEPIAT